MQGKHPGVTFHCSDVVRDGWTVGEFDHVVMNGVLTQRIDLAYDDMLGLTRELVGLAFAHTRVGLAFNVMSTEVDWERDDLFHLPVETAVALVESLGGRAVVHDDYGLYEYTVHARRR